MAADLRRMVVLGPIGTIQPGCLARLPPGRQPPASSPRPARAGCACGPTGRRSCRTRAASTPAMIDSLDEQIALARRDGLRIVLTLYRFPTWANGVDRMTQTQLDATMPDRKAADGVAGHERQVAAVPLPRRRLARERRGATSSTGSPRATAPATRARPSLDATIDVLEIVNEPNLQWWPQQGPSTDPADPFGRRPGRRPRRARRACSRRRRRSSRGTATSRCSAGRRPPTRSATRRLRTGYDTLSDRLLPALAAAGFTARPALRLDAPQLHRRHVRPGRGHDRAGRRDRPRARRTSPPTCARA